MSKSSTEPWWQLENVSPKKGLRYLSYSDGNRRHNNRHIKELKEKMQKGQWTVTHEAIAFDINGRLRDGHHRLMAVVESNVTVPMYVARGFDPSVFINTDTGRKRTQANAMQYQGLDYGNNEMAMIRQAFAGFQRTDCIIITNHDIEEFIRSHTAEIEAVCHGGLASKHRLASLGGPLIRAVINGTMPVDRLERFIHIYNRGFATPPEEADGTVVNLARKISPKSKDHHIKNRMTQYAVVQTAVKAFSEGRLLKNLRAAERDLFPI